MKQLLVAFVVLYVLIVSFLIGYPSPIAAQSSPSYHEQLTQVIDILLRIERKLK